ncbi:uncharacterized protein LOC143863492 isoform X1 [Tasmannia lanceolata]|uniref:uncharacterized protein LOC143863492 isoform X1 n=1 Tax=Tasmannia lanceolata TaxID=3420 RepID=UPI0040648777
MLTRVGLVLVLGFLGWAYQAIKPPPPKICGSPNGPPITSPRVRLRDGRYLAYKETGVHKKMATYKIIVVHAFGESKDFSIPASQDLVEELGIYFLSFDRSGYGESDPNPKRSVKSEAFDIQELADLLEIGPKFYVIGVSTGGYPIWSCLKYIPHRLAGAVLVVPIINYWWKSFPANLSRDGYNCHLVQDQWVLRIAHYAPPLFYWWMTQKWFPSLSLLEGNPETLSPQDKEIVATLPHVENNALQQGEFESIHRDLIVGFGTWEFDPMEINNPFLSNEGSVHIWQGYEDRLVPVKLQRHVSKRLPWIKYHEVPDMGHFLVYANGFGDTILRELLVGNEPSNLSA